MWRNFLRGHEVELGEEGYDPLGEHDINGRQIKNIVRTAKSLASYKKVPLDLAQLEQVTRIQMEFQGDLDHYAQPVSDGVEA